MPFNQFEAPKLCKFPQSTARHVQPTEDLVHISTHGSTPPNIFTLKFAAAKTKKDRMDPIDHFFANYPSFDYNRAASSPREFYRMCDHFLWVRDRRGEYPHERTDAHEAFRVAMVEAFNHKFGTDQDAETSWESMCYLLRIEPKAGDVAGMKKLVRSTHVNLSDLLDGGRSGTEVRIFETEEELAAYTIQTGRFFPKLEAYAGGVLRYLLREITGEYQGHKRYSRSKNPRRGGKRGQVNVSDLTS